MRPATRLQGTTGNFTANATKKPSMIANSAPGIVRGQQFRIFEGINAGGLMVNEVQCQDRDQHQQPAELSE